MARSSAMLPTSAVTPATPESCAEAPQLRARTHRPGDAVDGVRSLVVAFWLVARHGLNYCIKQVNQYYAREAALSALPNVNLMPKPWICYRLLLCYCYVCRCAGSVVRAAAAPIPGCNSSRDSQPRRRTRTHRIPPPDDKLTLTEQIIQDVFEPLQQRRQRAGSKRCCRSLTRRSRARPACRSSSVRFSGYYVRSIFITRSCRSRPRRTMALQPPRSRWTAALRGEPDTLAPQRPDALSAEAGAKGWKVAGFSPADFFSSAFNRTDAP